MKKSLALIGIKWEAHKDLINRLANHCQLILVSEHQGQVFDESIYDNQNNEVTIQSCSREGCWEADIIFLMNDEVEDLNLLTGIKEVCTQKTVVGFSETKNEFSQSQRLSILKQLLPHSKVLWGYIDHANEQVFIKGDDAEALQVIQGLVGTIGYRSAYVENPVSY